MYLSDYEAGESLGVGGAVEDSLYSCRARTLVRPFFFTPSMGGNLPIQLSFLKKIMCSVECRVAGLYTFGLAVSHLILRVDHARTCL